MKVTSVSWLVLFTAAFPDACEYSHQLFPEMFVLDIGKSRAPLRYPTTSSNLQFQENKTDRQFMLPERAETWHLKWLEGGPRRALKS